MTSRPTSPVEPTKKHPPPIQPNAHPYAIKTTSSALLSRSNSTPHTSHHTRHHYVPSPPSWIPTATKARHGHSSSLSSVEEQVHSTNGGRTVPAPLPTPPPVLSHNRATLMYADETGPQLRSLNAETRPSSAIEPITENHSFDQKLRFGHGRGFERGLHAGLPQNPKQWDADQLTTYLGMSFNSVDAVNGSEDGSNLADILECVRSRGFTGREFLRLTDADLAGTPLSDVQRAQILKRSAALRSNVLRRRIFVDPHNSHEVSATPFHSTRGASMSVDDLHLLDSYTDESESTFPPSPVMPLHRSNSVSDASAQRYRDLARIRTRRRGKVKGLVETWERASTSGSECSASEAESDSETGSRFEFTTEGSPESVLDPSFSSQNEPPYNVFSLVKDSSILTQEPQLLTPPPPYTHMRETLGDMQPEEGEPSIEELLASSDIPLRGARAWEVDFSLGETVKRVPPSPSADASGPAPSVTEPGPPYQCDTPSQHTTSNSLRSNGSGKRRSTGSKGRNAHLKVGRRVVTAIFTGSPPDDAPENKTDKAYVGDYHGDATGSNDVHGKTPAGSEAQGDTGDELCALEESIAATRTQLEAFRLRLEKVEADTAKQEAMFMSAQSSDCCLSRDLQLREQRSAASDLATAKPAELPAEETMSLADIARAIVARSTGWLSSYGSPGVYDESRTRTGSRPAGDNKYRSPMTRNGRVLLARMSCSIILFSFAVCATVFRKIGLGRWVRRP